MYTSGILPIVMYMFIKVGLVNIIVDARKCNSKIHLRTCYFYYYIFHSITCILMSFSLLFNSIPRYHQLDVLVSC